MTVGERAREVGLLRAAGATRAQVVRFVLAGALVIGVAGSALGLAVGLLLGSLMAGSVRTLTGFPAEVNGLDAGSLVIAFLVGLAITIAGAVEPAIRAARISPVEALRARLDLPAIRRARLRLAGPRLRRRGGPGAPRLAAGGGRQRAPAGPSPSTPSSSPRRSPRRSSCRRSPGSSAAPWPVSCASRSGSPAARWPATAAGPR